MITLTRRAIAVSAVHHHSHHHGPTEAPPVPGDCHVGINFTPASILTATSRRCKLLGQGGCGRVIAADMPAVVQNTPPAVPADIQAATANRKAATTAVDGAATVSATASAQQTQQQQEGEVVGPRNGSSNSSSSAGAWAKRVAIKTALPSHSRRWVSYGLILSLLYVFVVR